MSPPTRSPVPPQRLYLIIGQYFVTTGVVAGRKAVRDASFTARAKVYQNGRVDLLCAEKPIFREKGYEASFGTFQKKKPAFRRRQNAGQISEENSEITENDRENVSRETLERAIRRAKARVREIAMANDFEYFVTLTLDAVKVDRYDVKAIIRKLSAWCDNQARRHGLRYVIVPERHKDGALHFHGFMSWDGGSKAVESGTYTKAGWSKPRKARSAAQAVNWLANGAKPVYNLPVWTLGFSTAIEVYGEYGAAVGYVCKYVGKQMDGGKIGGRWYYSGGKLRTAEVLYSDLWLGDFEGISGVYSFDCDGVGKMLLWRGTAEEYAVLFGKKLADMESAAARSVSEGPDPETGVFPLLPESEFVPW